MMSSLGLSNGLSISPVDDVAQRVRPEVGLPLLLVRTDMFASHMPQDGLSL